MAGSASQELQPPGFGFGKGRAGEYHPPKTQREIRAIFRKYGEAAAVTLALIAGDSTVPPVVRVMACREILSRGYGSPGTSAPLLGEDVPDAPTGKLSEQDLATMDDATLAQVLMEEVAGQGRKVG